jgi:N-acetylmuramoyl-L-alanine amidase
VSKKIYINPGHSDVDPGAVGYETERKLNVKTAEYMNEYLLANYDCQTKVTDGSINSVRQVATDANNWGADLLVSIHNNAGGGDGYEALVYSEKRKPLGQIFEKHVKAIGQNSRGVKLRPDLGVLSISNMPAILNEGAFVDNKKDIQDWNEDRELKKLGEAYAKAAAEFLNLEEKKKPKNYYVRCTMNVGPFTEKETAESLVVALKTAGADVIISEK